MIYYSSEERCEKICSANLKSRTSWQKYGSGDAGMFATIDISHCGFTSTPAIMTSLGGLLKCFKLAIFLQFYT